MVESMIKPSVVHAAGDEFDLADRHAVAIQLVQGPHGAAADGDPFHEYVLAVDRLDKGRTQGILGGAEHPLFHRHVIAGHLVETHGPVLLRLFPFPPFLPLAVERACAGDGDVLAAVGIKQGRIVIALQPFPAGEDHGQVVTETCH